MAANKMSRRDFLRATAIATGAMAITACQPAAPQAQVTDATPQGATKAASACKMDWNPQFPPAPKKYDPAVEIAYGFTGWQSFPAGNDFLNNPVYNWFAKEMGLKFTMKWQADGDVRQQKLQADIAGGDLPDLFATSREQADELIDAGAVAEIHDIWEATATPLCKKVHLYPDGANWIPARRGDKLYSINPGITAKVFTPLNVIRQDLLDKASLTMPQTVEELDHVLHVLHDKNLVPYGLTGYKGPLVDNSHSFNQIFGAYGVMPTCWRDHGDGVLAYDSLSPEVKTVLGILRGWYKDGLIPPDYYTFDWTTALNQAMEKRTAMLTLPFWGYNRILPFEEANPGTRFEQMPLLAGPTGLRGDKQTSQIFNSWLFKAGIDPIKIEACINQLNWERDFHINGPDKYQAYGVFQDDSFFAEGYDWNWNDKCEIVLTEHNSGWGSMELGFKHLTYPGYQKDSDDILFRWEKEDQSKLNTAQKFWLSRPWKRQATAYAQIFANEKYEIESKFYGPRTKRMNEIWPDLDTMEMETFHAIVIGNKSLDDFDTFVTDWKQKGGDEFTAGVNQWYAAQKKS